MLKRLFLASVLLAPVVAQAAGTLPIALQQNVDKNGKPISGALLYIYQAGTTSTRQNAYSDIGLTSALSWPIVADGYGRFPMFYLADGSVRVRALTPSGEQLFEYSSMLVIGPSSGGASGGSVDSTAIASTGDVKFRPTSETLSGWVKLNGTTIGSASSGATQRANSDTQALFIYVWTYCPDTKCTVSTGRGASALADFNANKTIALPDWRAKTPIGLDDMGTTTAGALLSSQITSVPDGVTTPGAYAGASTYALTQANLPAVTLTTTIAEGQGAHSHTYGSATTYGYPGGASIIYSTGSSYNVNSATLPAMTGTTPLGGSGTVVSLLQPSVLGTWYLKL